MGSVIISSQTAITSGGEVKRTRKGQIAKRPLGPPLPTFVSFFLSLSSLAVPALLVDNEHRLDGTRSLHAATVRIQPIRWVIIDKASYDSYPVRFSSYHNYIKIAVVIIGRVFVINVKPSPNL